MDISEKRRRNQQERKGMKRNVSDLMLRYFSIPIRNYLLIETLEIYLLLLLSSYLFFGGREHVDGQKYQLLNTKLL